MCRLFGMTGGPTPVRATFWLLEAADSLRAQSHRDPDGTGLGSFDPDGRPRVDKQALPAYADEAFAVEARELTSRTFVAHIRYASTGAVAERNTHPFLQAGRLFAHNGVVGDLPRLEAELGSARDLVGGDTDSERVFALITARISDRGGDVTAGITEAARWVADELPLYALNIVLITFDGLWALRYPATHELYVLNHAGDRHLGTAGSGARSPSGTLRVQADDLASTPAVVAASERMDESPGWRLLVPGELLHVGPDLRISSEVVIAEPPARQLSLADLGSAAQSQH